MITIVELIYPHETLWGVEYEGDVKITASTPERAQELADELFGALE